MPTTIRALVVDPEIGAVSEATFERNDLKAMYALIRCHTFDCVDVELAGTDGKFHRASIWCDDEGALIEPDEQHCVYIGTPQRYRHLAGRLLVTGGADEEGEITDLDASITPARLAKQIRWKAPPVVPHFHVFTLDG